MNVLNPQWVTTGVYAILTADELKKQDDLPRCSLSKTSFPPRTVFSYHKFPPNQWTQHTRAG
jgi:hypothetical protein